MNYKILLTAMLIALALGASAMITGNASAQGPGRNPRAPRDLAGTGFTYQGQLKSGGTLVNGTCTLAFRLYDDAGAGNQIGSPITQTIPITGGLFTTQLNTGNEFGATAFNGDARWLEIRVSNVCPSAGSFTTLAPREPITPAPYALTAMKTAYKNVLVVAKQGGHYNTISAALTSISDNSATNRYLIYVAPGTYTETVTMKQYVDIEGAGELTTKITQTGSGVSNTGTVVGASNAELRFLTVENTGGSTYAIAIYNNSASPRLTHVIATASGGSSNNYGVLNSASSPTMQNVSASASGGSASVGIVNSTSSSPTMQHVTASASGGISAYGVRNEESSSPTMQNVSASASGAVVNNYGIYNYSSSSPTMQNVSASASGGSNSYGVYNDSSSPTMTNVTATGSGGSYSYGVHNASSSPTMTNVTASASGASTFNTGVRNNSSSSPTMTNVTASASGGTASYGIFNDTSSPTIQNSVISATGGTSNYGIDTPIASSAITVTVNNSQIKGSTNTIVNVVNSTTLIGASQLSGGSVSNSGVITCVVSFSASYTALNSSCN